MILVGISGRHSRVASHAKAHISAWESGCGLCSRRHCADGVTGCLPEGDSAV